MATYMKKISLAALIVLAAAGCGGNSNSLSTSRFAGTYTGTWVSLDNPADQGTCQWTFSSNGAINGQDVDPGRNTTFTIVGRTDALGNITTTSTPASGEAASLNGTVAFDSTGKLTGILTWGVSPALQYRYTFTKE